MRAKLLSTLLLITSISINAQITITSADLPNVNDSIVLSSANNNSVSFPILADTNALWDYSTLVPTIQMYDKYDNPFTFTSPFNLLFNVLNTSYGRDNYDLTSINIPLVQLTDAYDFLKKSNSSFKQIGAGYTINGAPLPFYYTSPDVIYNFPLTYQDNDSCDYQYGLPIPTLGYYGQTGHRVNNVNGWGTLLTPFGSFQTVLVTSKINLVDTIYFDTLNYGTNITRPTRYEFKWLANGMKSPVLQINANMAGNNLIASSVKFVDSLRSNVPHVGVQEYSNNTTIIAYPNPAHDEITIEFESSSKGRVEFSIFDIIGNKVMSSEIVSDNTGGNRVKKRINTAELQAGYYFIQINNSGKTATKQICIIK